MPPVLALALCTAFVFYLLGYDRRQAQGVSRALWIPTIWTFSVATKPLSTWFGTGAASVEAGSALDRNFLIGLLFIGIFILYRRRLNWPGIRRHNIWVFLLLGYMLASVVWSDIPFISFKRWVRELTAVVMALVVLSEQDPRNAMQCILRRTVYVLIPYSILLIKYYPPMGVEYGRWSGELSWIGVTLQKNGLGRLCMAATLYLIWTLIRRMQGRDLPVAKYQTAAEVFVLLLTLHLLKGPPRAYPATAIMSLALGVAAYLGLLWMQKQRRKLSFPTLGWTVFSIMALGTITPLVGGASVSAMTSLLGRDTTLTGRTEIWAGLLPNVAQRPVLGCGHGGFWTGETIVIHKVNESHNGYLEVLLQLGALGLLLTAMFFFSCGRMAYRTLGVDYDWGCLCISFLLMAVLHNITEASMDSLTSHLTATVLFLAVTSSPSSRRRVGPSYPPDSDSRERPRGIADQRT